MILLVEIDRYLQVTGMTATKFGRLAAGAHPARAAGGTGEGVHRGAGRMSARRDAPDATVPLIAALVADAAAAGCTARAVSVEARDWASATFVGTQARVVLALAGAGGDAWLARIPEAELPLWRHVVADIVVDADAIVAGERQVTLAVLTLVTA